MLTTAKPFEITTTKHKWEIPIPMENIKPTSVFPVEVFPNKLRRYIEAVAEHTQTPVDMTSVAVLTAVANSVQGKFKIESKKDYTEPLNIYCMVVAKPSERKSAITSIVTKPIRNYEKAKNKERKLTILNQQSELKIKKSQIDRLEKKRKD